MATATKRPRKSTSHPLAHLIPDQVKADEYVSRKLYGVKDIELLRYAREARKHVLITGDTGLGKSHMVEAYAATDRLPLVVIEAKDGIDPNTFFGSYVPKSDGGFEWVDSDVVQVMVHGGVLFIDEVNFMRPRVSATFHRVMREGQFSVLERGNATYKCSPDLQIIAAMNEGYEGTYPLNQAFRNRFALKAVVHYDTKVEEQLLCMPVLLDMATMLRDRRDEIESPISTNMLVEFEEFAMDLGQEFAVENFIASFSDDEKQAVREIIALHATQISEQLAEMERLAAGA